MRAGVVASVVAAYFGLVTSCGASCLAVLNYEPPHPHWQLAVADAALHPERAKVTNLESIDYDVSLYPTTGSCTLAVKTVDGKVLGRSEGGLCLVALTGQPGQTWIFEATSSSPNAEIQLAVANPIYPKPLKRVALGGAIVFGFGLVGALFSVDRRRRDQ